MSPKGDLVDTVKDSKRVLKGGQRGPPQGRGGGGGADGGNEVTKVIFGRSVVYLL